MRGGTDDPERLNPRGLLEFFERVVKEDKVKVKRSGGSEDYKCCLLRTVQLLVPEELP